MRLKESQMGLLVGIHMGIFWSATDYASSLIQEFNRLEIDSSQDKGGFKL